MTYSKSNQELAKYVLGSLKYSSAPKTFIDDGVSILSDEEDADDQEVEDDGEDDHDPGDDAPGLPAHGVVVSGLLLLNYNFNWKGSKMLDRFVDSK